MILDTEKAEWNEVKEDPREIRRHANKIWRKQFLRNPFKLGVAGHVMLLIWIAFSAFWIYRIFIGQTELVGAGTYSEAGRQSAWLSAVILFGILWLFTYLASPLFARWTVRRLAKQGRRLEDII
jgi:hypothetical protein